MNTLFRYFTIGLTAISLNTFASATDVTATVDKNPAMVDESIILEVVAKGDVSQNAFNSSPLLKDFVVGRTSVSSKTQIINSNMSKSTHWSTVLIPRQPGQYTIPAFNVDGITTTPIKLMVLPTSASKSAQGRDVFISTEVDVKQVYLQQQFRYTVKLHLAADLQRGTLSNPTLTDADIRQVGKDTEYSQIVEGKRYRIIERVFAVIPQKSGKFVIDGPLFEGEVVDKGRQSFGFFNRTKAISRLGPSLELTVLPVPANIKDHWLPSEFVQLHQEWQPANGEFTVGEPITRTLTLTAVGLVEEQLPEINSQYPDQLKIYPDQASTNTVEKDGTLIAQRIESLAMIPSGSGEITLPAVEIPWFNVITQQREVARLPARTITVNAGNGKSLAPALPLSSANQQQDPEQPQYSVLAPAEPSTPQYWSLSSWILLVLWLLTLLAWFLKAKSKSGTGVQKTITDIQEKALWTRLQTSMKDNDPQQTQENLTLWLAEYCGNTGQSLASSQAELAHPALNQQVTILLQSLFGKASTPWQATGLKEVIHHLRKQQTIKGQRPDNGLKTLYPTHS